MERKHDIENLVSEALNSAKKINQVEVPAFFTDKTMNRIKAEKEHDYSFSPAGLLKIAAVLVLVIMNIYTIRYILNSSKQETSVTATVSDLVNEYQPGDNSELTFDETINK